MELTNQMIQIQKKTNKNWFEVQTFVVFCFLKNALIIFLKQNKTKVYLYCAYDGHNKVYTICITNLFFFEYQSRLLAVR